MGAYWTLSTLEGLGGKARLNEIVRATGKKTTAVHSLLVKLMDKGRVRQNGYGTYTLSNITESGESAESARTAECGESSFGRRLSVAGVNTTETSEPEPEPIYGQASPLSVLPGDVEQVDDAEVF